MDVDQAARSNAQEYFGVKDPDYYEFEGKTQQIFITPWITSAVDHPLGHVDIYKIKASTCNSEYYSLTNKVGAMSNI